MEHRVGVWAGKPWVIGFCDTDWKSPRLCFSQLDNPDEQAAQIRRELDGRLQMADQIARVRTLGTFAGGQAKVPHGKTHYEESSRDKTEDDHAGPPPPQSNSPRLSTCISQTLFITQTPASPFCWVPDCYFHWLVNISTWTVPWNFKWNMFKLWYLSSSSDHIHTPTFIPLAILHQVLWMKPPNHSQLLLPPHSTPHSTTHPIHCLRLLNVAPILYCFLYHS